MQGKPRCLSNLGHDASDGEEACEVLPPLWHSRIDPLSRGPTSLQIAAPCCGRSRVKSHGLLSYDLFSTLLFYREVQDQGGLHTFYSSPDFSNQQLKK